MKFVSQTTVLLLYSEGRNEIRSLNNYLLRNISIRIRKGNKIKPIVDTTYAFRKPIKS